MKAIEIEALVYVGLIDRSEDGLVEKCFIAGANSKTVDEMILKAIELAREKEPFGNNEIIKYSTPDILKKVKQEFL